MVHQRRTSKPFFAIRRYFKPGDPGSIWSSYLAATLLAMLMLMAPQSLLAERLDVLLDLDNNPSTGCTLGTTDGLFAGVEQVLRTYYDATHVLGADQLTCQDPATNTLSAPGVVSTGGWPVGVGLGVSGGDVVETAIASSQLQSPASTIRLGFATLDRQNLPADALLTDAGADITLSLTGVGATPIPTLQELGVALLSLLLAIAAFHAYRRHPHAAKSLFMIVIVVGGIGLVWAAVQPDGDPSDWGNIPPLAMDATGESTTGDMDTCFGEMNPDALSIRCDVRPFVNTAPSFSKGADETVLEDAGEQTVAGWATAIDDGDGGTQVLTFNITNNTNPSLFSAGPAVAADGTLSYTAAADANGTATITLVLQDDGGTANGGVDTSAPQTFLINVTAVNDAPSFTRGADENVLEDAGAQTIVGWATDIMAGPADEGTQVLTFNVTNNTNAALFSAGPAVAADGTLTYTPAAGMNGSATITLNLADDGGTANGGLDTSSPQTFVINVGAVNNAPTFTKGADQTVLEDAGAQTVAGWATAIDDGDGGTQVLTFNVTNNTNPSLFAAGPMVAADGTLSYTAAADANGSATITLTLMDDGGTANGGVDTSVPQTFVINVTAVNDAPSFTKGADENVLEDAGAQTVVGWATDIAAGPADEGSQVLGFSVTNNTNAALFSAGPTVAADGVLTYTPAAGASGSATITLVLADDGGTANGGVDTSPPQTFVINVGAVNNAPTFTKGADQTVLEDAGAQTVAGWATAIDDGDGGTQVLTFNVTNNTNPSLFSAGPAVAADGTLSYTPAAGGNGSATITLVLQDDGGTANGGVDTSVPQTFVINVTAVNDAPSFTKGVDQTVLEDAGAQTVAGWATAIDDGDDGTQVLTFNVTNNTNAALFSAGPAVAADGTLSYTPAADANGSATITLSLMDDGGTANGGVDTSVPQTFVINVTAVNDAPTFTKGADENVLEDAGAQTVAGWATGIAAGPADESAQALSFSVTNNTNAALFSAGPAVAADGTLSYTAAVDANGSATITLTVMDDGGTANGGVDTSVPQTFVINVTAVNDAPSFTKGADQLVPENSAPQSVANWATLISAGPADEAGQTLVFNVTNNTNAALFVAGPAVDSSGTLTYTPAPGVSGSATITLALMDDGGTANGGVDTSVPQSFVIDVVDINNAPSFIGGGNDTVLEDAGPQSVVDWATAIDDGDGGTQVLSFNITGNTNSALFSAGPAIDAITGDLTYTPAANANGVATITVELQDDGGTANGGVDTSPPLSFDINVTAVNDPPQVVGSPAFDATGNVGIGVPVGTGLLGSVTVSDPLDGGTPTFSVGGTVPVVTAQGGDLAIAADGSFDYDPPAGFTGSDSFIYEICDDGIPGTACTQVTANLTVADMIWFIDNSSAAGGDGRLSGPFGTLTAFDTVNGAGGNNPAIGQCIHVQHTGTGYTGPVTLENSQQFVGTGATASIDSVCAITLAANSASLPVTGGTNPQITSAGNGINLASNNTLRGLTVGNTTGVGITGTAVGTLKFSEVTVDGTGPGIDITNGTLAAAFDEISSSDSNGITLDNLTGSFTVTSGTIASGTNKAVDVTGSPLALNVTLVSVSSAGGGNVGISLVNTTGTFTVNGGTISGKTGGDLSTSSGIGIYLSNAHGVSLSNMQLNDFQNFAIRGTTVTNFSLVDSTINGVNGTSVAEDEGSVNFDNLLGTATFTGNQISGGFEDNIVVTNNTGTLDRMTVTGGTIGLNANATGNDGILVESQATATLNVTVSGVAFSGARGDMVQCNTIGSSTMDCVLEDNTFVNTHTNIVPGGGGVTVSGGGANITQTYDVSGTAPGAQTFRGADGNSLTVNYVSGSGTVSGTSMNNHIGVTGVAGSGSIAGSGISVGAAQNVQHNATVSDNSVLGVTGSLGGIELIANVNAGFNFNATVTGNTVDEMGGFSLAAMYTLFGGAGTETGTACLDIRNNTLDASDAASAGSALFMDQISAVGHYNLPGYAGSPNGEFAPCGAGTASVNIGSYQVGRGNTLTDGPFPFFPGVEASLVCGVTGAGATCP